METKMICPVTGLECDKRCRQWNKKRSTCQLAHLRDKAFKMKDLARMINDVIEITG